MELDLLLKNKCDQLQKLTRESNTDIKRLQETVRYMLFLHSFVKQTSFINQPNFIHKPSSIHWPTMQVLSLIQHSLSLYHYNILVLLLNPISSLVLFLLVLPAAHYAPHLLLNSFVPSFSFKIASLWNSLLPTFTYNFKIASFKHIYTKIVCLHGGGNSTITTTISIII